MERLRIAVVGGAGHVGLPLSLLLAKNRFPVSVIDSDPLKIETLRRGNFPFMEENGPELLRELAGASIDFSTEHRKVADCDVVILTVGTPVDEHLNPDLRPIYDTLNQIKGFFRDGQVLILRSTLFPGTSERIRALLHAQGLRIGISFCPERIAQGRALQELQEFPQIISGSDGRALEAARAVFSSFSSEVVELSLTEAELAKLFTNAWRYVKFAVANQFYMMAAEGGMDFYRIRAAMRRGYRRAADFPVAGFAAGPCLFKDTMQLAAFNRQNFPLGHSAMLINETLPDFLVGRVKGEHPLPGARVGILGMAFKPDSDDPRESLAYKLRRLLVQENAVVLCSDPYVIDPALVPLEEVLQSCRIIFIGCPHTVYKGLKLDGKVVVDCWGFLQSEKVSD